MSDIRQAITDTRNNCPIGVHVVEVQNRHKGNADTSQALNAPVTPGQVKAYYDQFMQDRMLSYRIDGNLRIRKAIQFFRSHIQNNDTVIDVGCGIGIATEAIAKRAASGMVLGLDISEQNIWYANRTISLPNCTFKCLDIADAADTLTNLLPKKPSVITMCDVLEHIPENAVGDMLQLYARIGASNLRVLLTFPSAHHIHFLRKESPNTLQIIDNPISLELLARGAEQAGLSVSYFRMINVWAHSDYVHCVLERKEGLYDGLRKPVASQPGPLKQLSSRALMFIIRRIRRRRFVTKVFQERSGS